MVGDVARTLAARTMRVIFWCVLSRMPEVGQVIEADQEQGADDAGRGGDHRACRGHRARAKTAQGQQDQHTVAGHVTRADGAGLDAEAPAGHLSPGNRHPARRGGEHGGHDRGEEKAVSSPGRYEQQRRAGDLGDGGTSPAAAG